MKHCLLVFSEPSPGKEEAFHRWYDEVHLADLLRVPGIVAARRYAFAAAQLNANDQAPRRHLALYEIDADDPAPVLQEITARAGTSQMLLSDALDLTSVVAMAFSERPRTP